MDRKAAVDRDSGEGRGVAARLGSVLLLRLAATHRRARFEQECRCDVPAAVVRSWSGRSKQTGTCRGWGKGGRVFGTCRSEG